MYTILRVYGDYTTITETGDNLPNILSACAIYTEGPDLQVLKVWNKAGEFIVNYFYGA